MRVINVSLTELESKTLMIGFQGENQITQVRIDAAEILTDYPNATPTLIAKPLFGFAYPVIVAKEGTDVVWEIDNSVLSFHGDGEIQLTFTEGTVIAKSYVGRIRIKRSLAVNGEAPDPIETWEQAATAKLAEVDAQIGELEDMVEAAEAAKDEAQDIVDDAAADIQAAGAAQVQVVQAKGTEVLNSIPSDYSTLSGDVSSLSSAFDDNTDAIGLASSKYYQSAGVEHSASNDQVVLSAKAGDTVVVTINVSVENAFSENVNLQYYAYYTDGTNERIGFGKSKTLTYTLSKDLNAIGIYYTDRLAVLASDVAITVKVLSTETFYGEFNALKNEQTNIKSDVDAIKLFMIPLGEFIRNSYVEKTGTITPYNGWSRTDYIDISALSTLIPVTNLASGYNCFYDENKNFISSFSVTRSETNVSIPENAKYAIFSNNHSGMDALKVKYVKKTEKQLDTSTLISNTFASVYCETDIDAKLVEYGEIVSTSGLSDNFLFFTDPHPFYGHVPGDGQWLDGIFSRMPLVQKAYNSTATSFCLCGGDWLSDQDTPAQACAKLGYVSGLMKNLFDKHYMIAGNHDTNYQGTAQLSDSAFVNAMFNDIGKAYYTFKTHAARFYVFDTGLDWSHTMSAYRWEQIAWFANSLIENDDAHNVIGLHIVTNQYEEDFDSNPVYHEMAQNITALANAYNNKTTITLNSITYDFTNKTGIVEFAIAGHSHYDKITSLNNIPIMITDWLRDGEAATFDLVQADYTNHVVKTVRIGSGSNRTLNMASAS